MIVLQSMGGRVQSAVVVSVFATLLALSACTSKLGTQSGTGSSSSSGTGPQVVATPIGHKPAAGSTSTAVTITVRSGGDVVLSGKDSQPGSGPITSFAWAQATSDNPQVDLIYVSSNTVDFTAPTVGAETVLNFTLTAVDSNGNTGTAHAVVKVEPGSDPDQFLTAPATNPLPRNFQVAVVPVTSIPAGAAVPVCISMDRTVSYYERGAAGSTPRTTRNSVALPSVNIDANWTAASGGVGAASSPADTTYSNLQIAVDSYTNPRTTFDVPAFNDQDLFRLFNQPQGSNRPPAVEPSATAATRIAQQLVPADVDSVTESVTISATNGTCASLSGPKGSSGLLVAVLPPNQPPATTSAETATPGATLTFTQDELLQTLAPSSPTGKAFAPTAADTANYYANVDPIGSVPHENQTLNAWLDANCFDHTKTNYGADTHAVYTNNFDLGFGRDMYFVTCTAANLSTGRQVGDSASVVINYISLEAATLKQNPIIAVAMSHNTWLKSGASTSRITKFFAFAPDDRDGNYYLVPNANFDHRGQKYLPGSCTVCHGGTVDKSTIAAGDLNSAFMPWDESSLLFADTDPAFLGVNVPKKGYTEADQTANIYALNQHAYATFLNSAPGSTRFSAPKALIEKWYGGLAKTPTPSNGAAFTYTDVAFNSQKFDDSGYPGVSADASGTWAAENTANNDDLYHTVFAHGCRACHTQLDPLQLSDATVAADGSQEGYRFGSYTDFSTALAGSNGTAGIIPTYVYQQILMPLARLTADRFWVNYSGGTNPATILARVGTGLGVSGLMDTSSGSATGSQQAIPPGQALLSASFTPTSATRFSQVRDDSTQSVYVGSFDWTLCVVPTPAGSFGLPTPTPTSCSGNSGASVLTSSTSAVPAFSTDAAGEYFLTVSGKDTAGRSITPQTFNFSVPVATIQVPNCAVSVQIANASAAYTQPVDLRTCTRSDTTSTYAAGDCTAGNISSLSILGVTAPSTATPEALAGCPLTSDPTIDISGTGTAPVTVSYKLCDTLDMACSQAGTIVLTPGVAAQTPSVSPATYYVYSPIVAYFNGLPALPTVTGTSPTPLLTWPPVTLPGSGSGTVAMPSQSFSLYVDAWPSPGEGGAATCAPSGAATQADSLAQFFRLTPCNATEAFTYQIGAGATSGPVFLGGTDQVALSAISGTPNASALSVGYTITDPAVTGAPTSASSTLKVSVLPTQSFASGIFTYLSSTGANCTSCHNSGPTNDPTAAAKWTAGNPATAASAQPSLVACTFSGHPCIQTSAPSSSILYQHACTDGHATALADRQCANLLQWIAEGAPDN
ncbi:MAG TPA: hypothetical protein VMF03_19395 [Steroidobacteraceae bacterium]|nr:hypothetical protein [Steroidobacteraceae bacterium]